MQWLFFFYDSAVTWGRFCWHSHWRRPVESINQIDWQLRSCRALSEKKFRSRKNFGQKLAYIIPLSQSNSMKLFPSLVCREWREGGKEGRRLGYPLQYIFVWSDICHLWNMHWNVFAFNSMTGIYANFHGSEDCRVEWEGESERKREKNEKERRREVETVQMRRLLFAEGLRAWRVKDTEAFQLCACWIQARAWKYAARFRFKPR